MEVGTQIMLLREQKGLSREHMADELEMHVNTYKNIEYGRKIPDLKEIQKIAEILEVDAVSFLGSSPTIFSKIKDSPGAGIGNHVTNDKQLIENLTSVMSKQTTVLDKLSELLGKITK
jgi:ribosome-binding protein aMBF1 (putative translation factor)